MAVLLIFFNFTFSDPIVAILDLVTPSVNNGGEVTCKAGFDDQIEDHKDCCILETLLLCDSEFCRLVHLS